MTEGPKTLPEGLAPAGFWVRAAARIVDVVVIVGIYNLFYLGYGFGAGAGAWPPLHLEDVAATARFSVARVLFGVFVIGFPVFYYVYLHGAYGQTFGKMALGIRVVDEDGSPIGFRKAFTRWLAYFLSGPLTLGIGYAWAAFDARKQGFHDKACGTLVVHSGSSPRS